MALVMYLLVRRDLIADLAWPTGSVLAQAAHAAMALAAAHADHPNMRAYVAADNLDSMHKVVLAVKSEADLDKYARRLTERGLEHRVWVEQPENIPTALAVLPYPKEELGNALKGLRLFN